MKLEIQKIRLTEIRNFIYSEIYSNMETVPITSIRAESYLQNPNALPDDFVLYIGFIDKKMVAFRTLFADVIYFENKPERFAWCSGNWVHPNFRRKGFSEQLLNEAYNDWDKKLMFTNYAPESEKLYLKTGWFYPIHQFFGVRAYLTPKTKKLFQKKYSGWYFSLGFGLLDFAILVFSRIFQFFYFERKSHLRFEISEFPDDFCYESGKTISPEFFYRGRKELEWIFRFPWIQKNNNLEQDYPFSFTSKEFYYKTVKMFKDNEFLGFFIFSVRNGHLKTLYFSVHPETYLEIAAFIKTFCKKNNIETLTIYNKHLAGLLLKRKFPFLHAKKYGQKIYSTFKIKNNKPIEVQDGEGDVFFT